MHDTIIDWLTYRSYETQRLRRPDIPFYKWRKLYADAVIYEEIFDNYIQHKEEEKNVPIRTNQ